MPSPSQPSKREITRDKVIRAAIDAIYSDGFHAAHTNRIAEHAGVSWGVLQYHFGDKDGLLQAVIDDIFDDFEKTLATTTLQGENVNERVRQLIDVIWGLVRKKEYRVSVAILRNAGKDDNSSINGQKQLNRWAKKISAFWQRLLADQEISSGNSEVARHLLFAALRGMADEINPQENRTKNAISEECDALADAITYLLKRR